MCQYYVKETGKCMGKYGDGVVYPDRVTNFCTHKEHWKICAENPDQQRNIEEANKARDSRRL